MKFKFYSQIYNFYLNQLSPINSDLSLNNFYYTLIGDDIKFTPFESPYINIRDPDFPNWSSNIHDIGIKLLTLHNKRIITDENTEKERKILKNKIETNLNNWIDQQQKFDVVIMKYVASWKNIIQEVDANNAKKLETLHASYEESVKLNNNKLQIDSIPSNTENLLTLTISNNLIGTVENSKKLVTIYQSITKLFLNVVNF